MLLLILWIKLVAEVALMALLGRWLLGLLVGSRRDDNPFYRVLDILARPFIRAARWLSPRQVIDLHLPGVAALMLAFIWLAALAGKVSVCLGAGMAVCR